jgi:hypothetical protein
MRHDRPAAIDGAPARARADFGTRHASADVRRLADWVVASRDHAERPFALVDKVQATLYVFAPTGRLIGASPILLGWRAATTRCPASATSRSPPCAPRSGRRRPAASSASSART